MDRKGQLIRSKVLTEKELDYVSASKTLGTPNWKIILFQVLPNLSSIIIVSVTLNLAGNIGIECGLTFLGFGLRKVHQALVHLLVMLEIRMYYKRNGGFGYPHQS